MPALKRIILLVFLSQIVACGQKGALTVSGGNHPEQNKAPTAPQPSKVETKEANQ